MDQKQFLLNRQKGIGGSDVAAIMGLSPWKTPLDIYLEKTMPVPANDDFGVIANKPELARGRRCEKYILEEYADRTSQTLVPGRLVRHPRYPFLQGHVDAFVEGYEEILVEAKSVNGPPTLWNNEIPPYYKTQIAHYALVTDCERVDVPVLFDRWHYACFTYERDLEFESRILRACLGFWNHHVLKENPPKLANLNDIRSLYALSDATGCQATPEIRAELRQLASLLQARKHLTEREEALKLRIMGYMKNHDTLLDGESILATWKAQKRSALDESRLKADHPALYEHYRKDHTSRVFRLKGNTHDPTTTP
jgi:putative phage-type endonuclease